MTYTRSAIDEARALIADCTAGNGQLDRASLLHAMSSVFVALYRAEGRLPELRDIDSGPAPAVGMIRTMRLDGDWLPKNAKPFAQDQRTAFASLNQDGPTWTVFLGQTGRNLGFVTVEDATAAWSVSRAWVERGRKPEGLES